MLPTYVAFASRPTSPTMSTEWSDLITKQFRIDWKNSVDKRAAMEPTQFGYLSLHYIVSLSPARARLTEYKRFAKLKAEVQIRSILQHSWAEIEHDLGYKTQEGVPREIRRRFSRLAGMLEIADSEFVGIRDALRDYESSLPARLADTSQDVLLDKASLEAFFSTEALAFEISKRIAAVGRGVANPARTDRFEAEVRPLQLIGIESVGELRTALRENQERIVRFAERWTSGVGGEFAGTVSLLYLGYVLVGATKDPHSAVAYLKTHNLGIGNDDTYESLSRRIFDTYDVVEGAPRHQPRGRTAAKKKAHRKAR